MPKPSDKLPFIKWFPSDWKSSDELKFCSWEARYLWLELLHIMHGTEQRGFLVKAGRPFTEDELVELISKATPQKIRDCLFELESHNVFSRDRRGVIYSRRMVKAEKKAEISRSNGGKGGNPELKKKDKSEINRSKIEDKSDLELPITHGNESEIQPWDNLTRFPEARSHIPEARKKEAAALGAGQKRHHVDIGQEIAKITGWDQNPNWFGDYSRIEMWLKSGWHPDRDIIPTVKRIIASGKTPKNLKYFEAAIADAHAFNNSPTPEGKPNVPQSNTRPTKSERADAAIKRALESFED